MKKRLFSALLVLVMAVSVFSVTAFADSAFFKTIKVRDKGITLDYQTDVYVNLSGVPADGSLTVDEGLLTAGDATQTGLSIGGEKADTYSVPLSALKGCKITGVSGTVKYLPLGSVKETIGTVALSGDGTYSVVIDTKWVNPKVTMLTVNLEHSCEYKVENEVVTKDATCTSTGTKENTCIYCGHKEVTVIDALRHKLVDVSAKEPTCLEGGYSAHQKCSRCDYTEGYKAVDALGHDWGEWTVADNGSHERVCQREGCNAVDSHAAQLEKVEGEPATCTEKGLTDGEKCSVEDCTIVTKEQTEIDALGHKWGDWKDDGNGTHSRVCANDRAHVETVRHTAVTDPAVAATCTEDGKTEGSHCSVCDAVIKAQEKIPAIGHKYGEWADTKDGKNHQRVCANDPSHVETEKHEFGDWIVTVEATQTTDGSAYHVCKACGYKETAKIPAGNTKPQTGDESNALLYAVLMLTAVTGVVVTTGYAKKKAE